MTAKYEADRNARQSAQRVSAVANGLIGANAEVHALASRLLEVMCDELVTKTQVEAGTLAEGAVRAAAILCSLSAQPGNESTLLKLGGLLWLRLADEMDARNGYGATLWPMPEMMQ